MHKMQFVGRKSNEKVIKSKIIRIVIFVASIFLISLFPACQGTNDSSELTKDTMTVEVFENKLFPSEKKVEYIAGTLQFEEQLFSEISNVFKDKDTGKIIGFSFEESSGYAGYAYMRYSASDSARNGIGGYFVYRPADSTDASKLLKMSGQVFTYFYNNKLYAFDNLRQSLFILEDNKLKAIEPIR